MKNYSNLTFNERMEMSPTIKDRFITYGLHRVNEQLKNGTMNERVHALFQGKSESSITQILEQFYLKNKGVYEQLVESFNLMTETRQEEATRFNQILEHYGKELSKNPHFPLSHKILDEAVVISPEKTLSYLMNECCNVLSHIDVRSQLKAELFESVDAKQASLEIKDDPNYVLGLAESLSRAINYMLPKVRDKHLSSKGIKMLESLNNIYSIYKEGMDIVATQEYQASDLFRMFIEDRAPAYHFSIHRLNAHLQDPASFVQYGLRFLQQWMLKHRQRLSYKFPVENFTRLEEMYNIYEAQHPMLNSRYEYREEYWYNYPKLYSLLDLLLECSQMLRMDLRNLVCKYISILRPMIDSYRTDFYRPGVRTGY